MTLLFSFLVTSPVQAEATVHDAVATSDTLVIQIEPTQDLSTISAALAQQGMMLGRVWPEFGLAEVRLSSSSAQLRASNTATLNARRRSVELLPGVQHVELDRSVTAADRSSDEVMNRDGMDATPALAAEAPMDSLNVEQWAHGRLGVFESWGISRGSPTVAIAVIDSGCDLNHEDISPDSLWVNATERDGKPGVDDDRNGFIDDLHGWDWIENDDTANDPYGHGTHVGGAIVANTDNALGISSLGPDLRIVPLRVLDEQGVGLISDLIDALYYAYQKDVRIVNMSLVIQIDSTALRTAVEAAAGNGMMLVAASGNHSTSISWPAKYPETVAVAATDRDDLRGPFSNFGPETDLAAPGVDILSTYRDNGYHSLSGTSMAAAHVSALAGLIWSLRPDLSADELRSLMRETSLDVNASTHPGVDDYLGAGRIDYLAALSRASAGLRLQPILTAPLIAYSGESTVSRIAVAIDEEAKVDVSGAMVHYQLLPASGASDLDGSDAQIGQIATNVNGVAVVVFVAPERQGKYILRVQVGQAVLDLPVDVVSRLASVELIQPDTVLRAGDAGISLQITIRDAEGKLVAGETLVHLKTDLGHFDNGQTEMALIVTGSPQPFLFHPGRVAGTATLTVQLGNVVRKHTVLILPDQAARIGLASSIDLVRNWAASDSSPIHLYVADRYGNPVTDGTPVHLAVDRGLLAETRLASQAGSVITTLTVSSGVSGPAYVWAAVPGTLAEAQVEVPLMSRVYWFPMLAVD